MPSSHLQRLNNESGSQNCKGREANELKDGTKERGKKGREKAGSFPDCSIFFIISL